MPSSNGDPQIRNLRADLLRAAARADAQQLYSLIASARIEGVVDEEILKDHLRVALQSAAKKGNATIARILLEQGAPTDLTGTKGNTALWWAVNQPQTQGHLDVIKLLLDRRYKTCPANTEYRDEDGRTVFMAAAWKGHVKALKLLLSHGVDINARDKMDGTILHNLACDKRDRSKMKEKEDDQKRRSEVVALLLSHPIHVDERDCKGRTALHWAVTTGKEDMVMQLIERVPKVNINQKTSRGKTALHLACNVDPPNIPIVRMLLQKGADASAQSDGGWTCLHNSAGVQGSEEILGMLLAACPSLLNETTSNGMTALHFASQVGSTAAVRCLMKYRDIKYNVKDIFYMTPLLRAAQEGHFQIVELLAPYRNIDHLGDYALEASQRFEATVVDFRSGSGDDRTVVDKKSVYEVLYGINPDDTPKVSTDVHGKKSNATKTSSKQQAPKHDSEIRFRWIHLPANNLAWAEALISKAFIENGCRDVDGVKGLERCFSQQHRGEHIHASFMAPLCQKFNRGFQASDTLQWGAAESTNRKSSAAAAPTVLESSPERNTVRGIRRVRESTVMLERQVTPDSGKAKDSASLLEQPILSPLERRMTDGQLIVTPDASSTGFESPGHKGDETVTPQSKKGRKRQKRDKPNQPNSGPHPEPKPLSRATSLPISEMSLGRSSITLSGSNICLFMPYLHFETDGRRKQMRQAIKKSQMHAAERPQMESKIYGNVPAVSPDEALVLAHLHSTTGLHLRRTLDQFYLHGIDTEDRDSDQVVGRYTRRKGMEEKIFMVDQLWMWVLGPGLVITCFPQRWHQPKNDPLNVLDGVIEDIHSKTRTSVTSAHDLALLITARCTGAFDRHRPGDETYRFMEMFESSIGDVHNSETNLFSEFYEASNKLHTWVDENARDRQNANRYGLPVLSRPRPYPSYVDRFLDIGKEVALLEEIKDIKSELSMLSLVLKQQETLFPTISDAICDDLQMAYSSAKKRRVTRRVQEQRQVVTSHLQEIERMTSVSRDIEESLLSLLDLKQKQSNAFEARYARDQAASTIWQGQIIMTFTVVTIVFLPISFMAQFFTINIEQFPKLGGGNNLDLRYVIKYMLGIGLGMSALLVLVAFSINPMRTLAHSYSDYRSRKRVMPIPSVNEARSILSASDAVIRSRFSSDTRRRSAEEDMYPRYNHFGSGKTNHITQRRIYSNDIERGMEKF